MECRILGNTLPYVACSLGRGEATYTEKGGMAWMKGDFDMSTNMEGGLLGSITRKMAGESIFMTTYSAKGNAEIAFASEYSGEIRPLVLGAGQSMICRKDAFMAAERSAVLSAHFHKKVGMGFFGGEGLFLTTAVGPGRVWLQSMPISGLANKILSLVPGK